MRSAYILIILVILSSSCSSWKGILIAKGSQNAAIQNAIYDFLHSGKASKDTVYAVYVKNTSNHVLGVSISADPNTLLVITEDSIDYSYRGFPTRYLEHQGKLFYWDDSTSSVTNDLIATFTRYNRVDTMVMNAFIPERIIRHGKKGFDYYFCKDNLLKYKKVHTTTGLGRYVPPKLKCNPVSASVSRK